MPQYFSSKDFTRGRLSGTVISAIAYGMVLFLAVRCYHLLAKAKHIYSRAMKLSLLTYLAVMLSLSTASMIEELVYMELQLFRPLPSPTDLANVRADGKVLFINDIPLTIPLVIWGADGFMLWRCFVLYQSVSRPKLVVVIILLTILSTISLGAGILFYCPLQIAAMDTSVPVHVQLSPFISWLSLYQGLGVTGFSMTVTPFVNTFLAGLIAARLFYHQYYVVQTLGYGHEKPYNKVITMCVESCALIALVSALYIGLAYGSSAAESPYALANGYILLAFPHFCVLSPFLIIARVAQGRAATTTRTGTQSKEPVSGIDFRHISSSNSAQVA